MKRIALLVATGAVALTAGVSAAGAQVITNETVSQHWSGYVSCANGGAGELVNGNVDVQNLVTETVNGNVDAWQFQFQAHGSLVGSSTGDTYQLAGLTRGSYTDVQQSDEHLLTYVNSYHLIGPGTDNNLTVREVAHVTIDGDDAVVQHDDFTIVCA